MPRVKAPKPEPKKMPKHTTGITSYIGGGVFGKRFCTRHGITTEDCKRMEVAEVTIITMSRWQLLKTLAMLAIIEVSLIVVFLRVVLPPK